MRDTSALGALASAPPRRGTAKAWGLGVALGLLVAAMAVALILTGGAPWAVLVPVGLAALLLALCRAPLAWSVTALLVAILSLDLTTDALGKYHTPLAFFGDLLQYSLEHNFARFPGLGGLQNLNGLEMLALVLAGIVAYRRAVGSTIDPNDRVQTASTMADASLVFLAAVAYATLNGLSHGGSRADAIMQIRPLLHVPVLFFLFHAAYRGPADHRLIGRAIVFAACLKALLAIWVYRTVARPLIASGYLWLYSTNHGDSILFAVAATLLIVAFLERPERRRLLRTAALLPLVLWGMLSNHRRLAWVSLGASLATIYVVSPWRGWKRSLTLAALVAVPVALLYTAVGWDSGSRIFAPVRMLRSISDERVDRSTLYREIENWNLAMSISEAPVLGRGFGHGFTEYVKGDDISSVFKLYLYQPHNSVLGLMLFGGLLAFTGMWGLIAVGIFLAIRSSRFARVPEDRAAALTCLAAMIAACVQTYGDLGPFAVQWQIFVALALAVSGKLAVATGAWPHRVRSSPLLVSRAEEGTTP